MKKLLAILCMPPVLGACAVGPTTGTCVKPPITAINVNYVRNSEIRVSPPNARPHLGNVLRFKLTGDASKTVTVKGKASDPDASWISGTRSGGSGSNFIHVCVDQTLNKGQTYSYDIDVQDVGTLDPEVTIRR